MRIAIVDDSTADREQLASDLKIWAESRRISLTPPPTLFSSGEELMSAFSSGVYDVFFLDIHMDGINGMDLARRIRETDQSCCLVFVTRSHEFAVDGYDVAASYYLVKPYTEDKLAAAMQRCGSAHLERVQYITIPRTQERIFLHSITYTEYADRRVHVHFQDGSTIPIAMTHVEFAGMLLKYPYFCDCMRGILVNFEAVDKLTASGFVLYGGQHVPISRLKYADVRKSYLDFSYARMRADGSAEAFG